MIPEIQFSSFLMPHAIQSDMKTIAEPRHEWEVREPVCMGNGHFEGDSPLCYPQGLSSSSSPPSCVSFKWPCSSIPATYMSLGCYFETEAVLLGEWNLFLAYRGQRSFEK